METRSNRLLIFVIIFLLAAGCLIGCGKKAPEAEAPMVVQAEKVQAGAHALSYTYAGDVRGRYESQFAFQGVRSDTGKAREQRGLGQSRPSADADGHSRPEDAIG